jgi:predicted transcriptional regulator
LGESDGLYPGITEWWKRRVIPGLESGERRCRMVSVDGAIAAVAIAKYGRKSSKLCTLRVGPRFQRNGIGQQLLRTTLRDLLQSDTRRIHFTISEEIFSNCGSFFTPYGFHLAHWKKGWYVRGMYEMAFSAPASLVADAMTGQFPLFGDLHTVLLSIRPQFATAIEQGTKLVEFRKKFSHRAKAAPALIYATSPTKEIRATAQIADVIQGTPTNLWERFSCDAGCTKTDFDAYFENASTGFAIPLSNVRRLEPPVSAKCLSMRQPLGFRPPQSFAMLPSDNPIVRLVAESR